MSRSVLCVVFVCAAVSSAAAQEIVLHSPDHSIEVKLVPIAGGTATYPDFLVSWDHLSSGPPSGAAIFYRDGTSTHNFISVGKVGPFTLVDNNEQTLVAGTAVPVYRLVPTTSQEIEMRVDVGQHPQQAQMVSSYEQAQGLAHAKASKADVTTALDAAAAAYQQACGPKPKFDIKWSEFTGERAWLPSALGAAARGLADKCAVDKKYKAPIAKLDSFSIHFDSTVKADELKLHRTGNKVEMIVGAQVINPRQRATAWITSDL